MTVKLTVRELFNGIEMEIPKQFIENTEDVLTNVAYTLKHVREDGAIFCSNTFTRNRDVNDLIKELLIQKPKVIFVTKEQYENLNINGPIIMLDNVYRSILKISKVIRSRYHQRIIGITGSLGKTTTKDIIYSALAPTFYEIKSFGNENLIGYILKNLQRLTDTHEFLIQEYGSYLPGIISDSSNAVRPDAAVITNIATPHLDVFKSKDAILQEKLSLVKAMMAGSPVFLNYDDELLRSVNLRRYKIISIGIDNKDVDYYADNILETSENIKFDIVNRRGDSHSITLNLRGRYNVYNALMAFAIGDYYGSTIENIIKGIEKFRPTGIRQNLVNIGGQKIYMDAYNTAPESLVSAISILEKFDNESHGKKIAIIADMARLGEFAPQLHKETGENLSDLNVDIIYCFGNNNAKIMAESIDNEKTEVYYTDDRDVLNSWIVENVKKNDILLFKGPVNRLLNKSVDLIYGSSFHFYGDYFEIKTEEDFQYKILYESDDYSKKTVFLRKVFKNTPIIEIPDSYNNIDIFGMAPGILEENKEIKSLIMPNTIRNIPLNAFKNCENLETVKFSNSLNVIEINAFRNCKSLKQIEIPNTVTHIDDNAFMDCDSLEEVIIPNTVGYFGNDIFKNSNNVTFKYSVDGQVKDYLTLGEYKIEFFNSPKYGLVAYYLDKVGDLTEYNGIKIVDISEIKEDENQVESDDSCEVDS